MFREEFALERIRVLMTELPPKLHDVLKQAITDQPDMEVVGELAAGVELLLMAGQTRTDVVILSLENSELPGICTHLLNEYPDVKVLAVSADGRRGFLYALRPQRIPLDDVSPEGLIDAIRVAVRTQTG